MEICANSGTLPGDACPERRQEIFAGAQLPLGPEHDLNRWVKIDRSTGELATESCPGQLVEKRYFFVLAPEYRTWAESHGYPQPPTERCPLHPSSGVSAGPTFAPQAPTYVWPTAPFATVATTPYPTAGPIPYATPWPAWTTYPPGVP
jgi:hypothetical protein